MNYGKQANRILESYRMESKKELNKRYEEVFEKIPAYKKAYEERNRLGIEYVKENMRGRDDEDLLKKLESYDNKLTEILEANGFPIDYLEEKYRCPICEDKGVVNGKTCTCKRALMTKIAREKSSLNEQMKSENFENFDPDVYDDDKLDSGYSQRDYMDKLRKYLEKYAKNYEPADKSLIFYGDVGLGKTYLMTSIAKEIIDKGYSVVYHSAPQLAKILFKIRYNNFNVDPSEYSELEDMTYNCDVLMIDDLGTELNNDTNSSNLFDLINDRIQAKKTTIISTNIDISDIENVYDKRIASRIRGEFEPIRFFGKDIREKRFYNNL
ncbi:MAG: ATP-binding protein [Finegoldia sp.]|nr:ATP-binding protein [Finegoldia sp.]